MEFAIYQFIRRLLNALMGDDLIPLRRHRIQHVEAYDVTPDELARIKSSAGSMGLDFQAALFCLTEASAFLTALILTPPASQKVFVVFCTLTVVGFILGAYFGIGWFRQRSDFSTIIDAIEERQVLPLAKDTPALAATPAVSDPALPVALTQAATTDQSEDQ